MAFQLAMMGSCALVAIVEPGLNKIHVACTGDSRAVMGTWEPSAEEDTKRAGSWMLRQLTEDQTSANPKEAKRYATFTIHLTSLTSQSLFLGYNRSIPPTRQRRSSRTGELSILA